MLTSYLLWHLNLQIIFPSKADNQEFIIPSIGMCVSEGGCYGRDCARVHVLGLWSC